ncbi:MAG: ABC transporter permease [Acidobacteria bacterium]|nr:ABC transporter permease [Acidobacteriota bacterium]MCA1609993.1 ABC transporter permease [Acidobacteriota bacterium]
MSLSELLAVAVEAIRRHRLRSALTLCGIVMGVATVVSVISIISGLNGFVQAKILAMNPDVLVFTKYGIIRNRVEFVLARRRKAMTLAEARWIERECRSCAAIGAVSKHMDAVHVRKLRIPDVEIRGHTANMASMVRLDLDAGRTFTVAEEEHAAAVAILGSEVKDRLFPTVNPVGQTIYVRGYPLRVIGTQTRQGNFLGQNRDSVVITPITLVQKILTASDEVAIYLRPRRGLAGLEAAQDEVRRLLRSLRKTPFASEDPFGIVGSEAVQTLWGSLTSGAFALMVLISGISLVVGAIVIANILFISVVERTSEIGMRMAVGARRRDIMRQFLLEATLLAGAGGVIGVLLGSLTAQLVAPVFPADVRPVFAAIGLGLALLTGLAAGIAPALAASRVPPIEALRFE